MGRETGARGEIIMDYWIDGTEGYLTGRYSGCTKEGEYIFYDLMVGVIINAE